MKGKITIEFENGVREEFSCDNIEYTWNRDIPYTYESGQQDPIGHYGHTANLIINGTEMIPTEIYKKQPTGKTYNSNFLKSCDWCGSMNCKKRDCLDKEELRDRMESSDG